METIIALSLVVIAVEFLIAIVFFILTLVQIRAAARAIEVLTYRVDDEVDNFSTTMRSGWLQVLQATASLAAGFWNSRNKD